MDRILHQSKKCVFKTVSFPFFTLCLTICPLTCDRYQKQAPATIDFTIPDGGIDAYAMFRQLQHEADQEDRHAAQLELQAKQVRHRALRLREMAKQFESVGVAV